MQSILSTFKNHSTTKLINSDDNNGECPPHRVDHSWALFCRRPPPLPFPQEVNFLILIISVCVVTIISSSTIIVTTRWVNSAAWLSAPGIIFSIIFSLPNYFMVYHHQHQHHHQHHHHLHHHLPQLFTVEQNETRTTQIGFNATFNLSTALPEQLRVRKDAKEISFKYSLFQEDETVVGEVTSIEILANGTWVSKDKPTNGEIWDD